MTLTEAKKIKEGTVVFVKKTNKAVVVEKVENSNSHFTFYMTDGTQYEYTEVRKTLCVF